MAEPRLCAAGAGAERHCDASPRCFWRETWLGKAHRKSLLPLFPHCSGILVMQAGTGWTAPSAAPVAPGAMAVT